MNLIVVLLSIVRTATQRRALLAKYCRTATGRSLVATAILTLIALCGLPAGVDAETRSHTFESAILAEARIFEVDLPLGYETSQIRYPVVYLLHGCCGAGLKGLAFAAAHAEKLVYTPIIVVRPNLSRSGAADDHRSDVMERYLTEELVPFIDATYRTIATRDGRAISGWSMGGADAVYMGLDYPDVFSEIISLAGGHANPSQVWTWARLRVFSHPQHRQPLGFWFWHGSHDNATNPPRPVVDLLQALRWPHDYLANDGRHSDIDTPVKESLAWVAARMWSRLLGSTHGLQSLTRKFYTVAGTPMSLAVEAETFERIPALEVDLSPLGRQEPLRLVSDGNGHLAGAVELTPPPQNGTYRLGVRSIAPDVEPFVDILLDVYPATDLTIIGSSMPPDWSAEVARITTASARFEDRDALQIASTGSWRMVLDPEAPVPLRGYGALALEFHPAAATVAEGRTPRLRLVGQAGGVDLTSRLDLAQSEWQSVVVPLDEMGLTPDHDLITLRFDGNLEGTFYLADLRLTTSSPPDQPESEIYPTPLRFVDGTDEQTMLADQLPIQLYVDIELDEPELGEIPPLAVDASALGHEAPIPLRSDGEGRYRARIEAGAGVPSGYHYLPVLQMTDPPLLLAPYHLSVFPVADAVLYGDGGWTGWEVIHDVDLDPDAPDPVHEGERSLSVVADGRLPGFRWIPTEPVPVLGYHLHLAFYSGDLAPDGWNYFNVTVYGAYGFQEIRFLDGATDDVALDASQSTWQTIDVPFDFPLDDHVERLDFTASSSQQDFHFFLDDIRLVSETPPAVTAVTERRDAVAVPDGFTLLPNYPNPFNSGTVIRFALGRAEEVELEIYDLLGQQVATLVSGHREAGHYAITWDGRDGAGRPLASGVYFYRLRVGARVDSRRMALVR